jgi:hypothetical protein
MYVNACAYISMCFAIRFLHAIEFITKDLRSLEQLESSIECEGRVLVNWKKLETLGTQLLELTRAQEIKYQLQETNDVRVYLAIQKIRKTVEHEKISKVLEFEEKSSTTRSRRASIRMRKIDSKEFYRERDRERKNLELSRSDSAGRLISSLRVWWLVVGGWWLVVAVFLCILSLRTRHDYPNNRVSPLVFPRTLYTSPTSTHTHTHTHTPLYHMHTHMHIQSCFSNHRRKVAAEVRVTSLC